MSRESVQQLFMFPMKGIVRTKMKNEQPEGTCFDAVNVRPFDQIENRARGGSRPGLKKWSTARTSNNRVQDLNKVTTISSSLSATSLSRRTIVLVTVTNGVISYKTSAQSTNATVSGTQALGNAAQSPFAFSSELFGKLYYADGYGYKIYNHTNTTAYDWTPTAGSLPGDQGNNVVCRLIETWRGRIVMSGLASDPYNWFMSKLGDPLDWDYAPATETELDAVTGGVGFVGKVPDVINALIPYTDDVLLIGCDHSIWMMSGDPQAGGRLDLVTNTVGMAFGRPYTQLPDGTLVFFSNRGSVYRMAPGGGKPVSISEESIDPILNDVSLNTNIVRMAYDETSEGVHMWITSLSNTASTHWYYDIRNEGWFKVEYPLTRYNPVTVLQFDGDEPADRTVLIGSEDGYIRQYSSAASTDDGEGFESYATMGPIVGDKGRYPCILTDVQFVMDDTSTNTIYEIGAGDTAEAALADFANTFTAEQYVNANTQTTTGAIKIFAGRSYNINPRTRGYFIYFKVGSDASTNTKWAIEHIQASWSIVKSSKGRQFQYAPTVAAALVYPPLLPTNGLYAAYFADTQFITKDGSNQITKWTPSQVGPGKTQRNFVNNNTNYVTHEASNTVLNNRGVVEFVRNGLSRTLTFNTNTVDNDLPVNQAWFATMAIMFVEDSTGGIFLNFDGPVSADFRISRGANETIRIYDPTLQAGSGDGINTNTATVVNTPYILTIGGLQPGLNSVAYFNATNVMNDGLYNWGFASTTTTIKLQTQLGIPNWRLGAIAFYAGNTVRDNTDLINTVESRMATYYGITLN